MNPRRIRGYSRAYFLDRDIQEVENYRLRRIRADQLACFHWAMHEPGGGLRRPVHVLDVGAGRGELSAMFALCGIPVTGLDPSPAAASLYARTLRVWAKAEPRVIADAAELKDPADTVIFCESLEHIPEDVFNAMWPRIVEWLNQYQGRLIVANWEENHPIEPDGTGWDHVRRVDDALYDWLAEGRTTVFRRGSHLVVDFR